MTLRADHSKILLLAGCGLIAACTGMLAGIDPRLALAGAFGIAFVVMTVADLAVGLAIFMFLGFVVVVPNFAGQTLSIIKIAAIPLLLSWLAIVSRRDSARKTFIAEHPGMSMTMFVFLCWAALSYVWAESGPSAFGSVFRYALAMILVLIVFTAVQRERDVRIILTAMVAGAACAGFYGFLHPPEKFGDAARVSGTLGNPNDLAAVLVVGIGLAGGLAAVSKSPLGRGLAIGSAGICLISLLLTASRGGVVACAVMLVAAIVLARGKRLAISLATLMVLLFGIGYLIMAAPKDTRDRLQHTGSGSGRTDIWTVGQRMVRAHPIRGVGTGNFTNTSIHYLLEPGSLPHSQFISGTPQPAENTYLEVLAELGVVGAALFLSLVGFGLGCSISAMGRFRSVGERNLQALAAAIAIALVGLLASDVFAAQEYNRNLWLLLGLGPALLAIAKRMEAAPSALGR